ncbi:MAG: DUF1080 domain-containing protein [Planctomycetaceae bacterium]|nr:DUF1080 domain-containing protein [Planctomycetaceae bacterium]
MRNYVLCAVCLLICPAGSVRSEDVPSATFEKLFNGKNLSGWKILPGGSWRVEQGTIIGRSPKSEPRHGLLLTEQEYDDFELRVKFQVLEGNSGIYFRCEPVEGSVGVHGFQAEVENSPLVGGLYETGGRAWVAKPDPALTNHVYKAGEWNEMHVLAQGKEIRVKLNGHQTVHLRDDPGRERGHIALQLHGGQEMWVLFKDLEIKRLSR